MRVESLTQWYPHPLSVHNKSQRDWLFAPGFFTLKLKLLGKYSMVLINQGEMAASLPDAAVLDVEVGTNIWFREVLMKIDDKPCVIGRSIAVVNDLQNSWPQLLEHGGTAIGYVLFEDPEVNRSEFECAKLQSSDPLELVARKYDNKSEYLNARRSWFTKNNSKLMVSECFLHDFWEIAQ